MTQTTKKLKSSIPYIHTYTDGTDVHIDKSFLASLPDLNYTFIVASTTLYSIYSYIDTNRDINSYDSRAIFNIWSKVLMYNTCLYAMTTADLIDEDKDIMAEFINTLALSRFSYKNTYDFTGCCDDFFAHIRKQISIIDKSHLMTYKVVYTAADFN